MVDLVVVDVEIESEVDHQGSHHPRVDVCLTRPHSFRTVVDRHYLAWRVAFGPVLYNI
jgi:hypothetical protein